MIKPTNFWPIVLFLKAGFSSGNLTIHNLKALDFQVYKTVSSTLESVPIKLTKINIGSRARLWQDDQKKMLRIVAAQVQFLKTNVNKNIKRV